MAEFTHFNDEGRAKMVDVGEKSTTKRTAIAAGCVQVSEQTLSLIRSGGVKKGDVLTVAQVAGIMAAKQTGTLIPMCHPLMLNGIDLSLKINEERCCIDIQATVSCSGKTGVEMEALTGVNVALLTIYDMCKAVSKDMIMEKIHLVEKHGGKSGDYIYEGSA